jgi:hypothetical protein
VPAGQFSYFDFKREDLRVAGEEGTGRLQVRAGIQVALMDGSVRSVKSFPVTIELMDSHSGGSYYTGTVTVSSDGLGD